MPKPKWRAETALLHLEKALQALGIDATFRITGGSRKRPQIDLPEQAYLIYFRRTGNYKLFRPRHEPSQHLLEAAGPDEIAQQIHQILGGNDDREED